ncbi:RNA polymerase subunit sigma [Sporosarcina thermotolerans]|uniref:RNA polymerase subunit sigma n=1 Tax=Sporosarcina thermotolerans TaxID=633404 RepID=A0AAW9A7I9_9BACL|nr:RNA polymerase subunit sigma [Sporosarcina thermotolerans]MDW0115708.1 RNA polymerase subunit sigma [Sporosarcina thermotolerans]WHT47032.1 RNA polymerase subunit sigma [Sporosarcina thermotolerans]
MSLKGIELQIAIPRTFDAGKLTEQKQQQPQIDQGHAQSLNEKEVLKNRETVLHTDKYAKTNSDANSSQQEREREPSARNRQQREEEKKAMHPYKGSFVDFTG